jgi:hypothetical protein
LTGLVRRFYHGSMELFSFILGLVILGPIAKAIAVRIQRGSPPPQNVADLKKTLHVTEQRLAETETRLAAVEERLDFYEKLLANPAQKTPKDH